MRLRTPPTHMDRSMWTRQVTLSGGWTVADIHTSPEVVRQTDVSVSLLGIEPDTGPGSGYT
ncbi:hypothetical protein GCM10009727_40430 [Actinomadura napierensis]|uniref:Uncharacterized protein n=1 Tax=Actinomadura napierensis TaxID=267854 RepID=A0ABP5LC76_9ACTN